MPPKRKFHRTEGEALPPIPGLQHMGRTDDMIKGIIFALAYCGKSCEEIGRVCHVTSSTVTRTVAHVQACLEAAEDARPRADQPRAQTPDRNTDLAEPPTVAKAAVDKELMRKRRDGTFVHQNCRAIRTAVLEKHGLELSLRSVQRTVKELGADYVRRPVTSPLNEDRMAERVRVAKELISKLNKDDTLAGRIAFTDECILRAEDTNIMCLRRPEHDAEPRRKAKWTAQVHVWGAIGEGFRQLVFLHENVNSEDYQDTLKKFLFDARKTSFIEENRVLMQDGARPHTAKATMKFLEEKSVEVLPWAAYSPDWNPIENMWSILKRRLNSSCFDSKEELMEAVDNAWDSIPQETLDNLALSFQGRLSRTVDLGAKIVKFSGGPPPKMHNMDRSPGGP